jgi:tRNA1Val (adenine37-N6)-methyltransferase
VELNENERLDDLQIGGLYIIQDKTKYNFTADAVLLAGFSKIKNNATVVDLGTGSGVIATLLAYKSKASKVYGVEIQSELASMAKRSVEYNKLSDKVEIINCDMKECHKIINKAVDVVVCNPPYFKKDTCSKNESEEIAICRHEIKATLVDVILTAKRLLKFGGKFFLVHKSDRVAEIIYELKNAGLEPKRIRFVQGLANAAPHLVLIESVLGGASGVIVEKNLVLNNDDGSLTEEAREIYSKEEL